MAWLHENKEEFRNAVLFAAEQNRLAPAAVEKDYYVTLILKGLKERLPFIVFKGGTSLSKCHKVINRFSEDIDVTIDTKLSQGQMGKVKDAIKSVAEELGVTIPNIDETRSRRSYNRYILEYDSVVSEPDDAVQTAVLMETSFAEVSFPTVVKAAYLLPFPLGRITLAENGVSGLLLSLSYNNLSNRLLCAKLWFTLYDKAAEYT